MSSRHAISLHGRTVLIKSATDAGRNPPTGLRGTFRVTERPEVSGQFHVEVVLQYPDMFTRPAQERALTLDEAAVERLLRLPPDEALELTVPEPLEAFVPSARVISPESMARADV